MTLAGFLRPERRPSSLVALALALLGLALIWNGLFIQAKAGVAQILLRSAWERSLKDGDIHKPWSWADTWPVAEVRVPRLGKTQIVLAGTSGQALAFGPGLMSGLSRPGEDGLAIIAAHRDTHFGFLQKVETGDVIEVGTHDGLLLRYQVSGTKIVRFDDSGLHSEPGRSQLALVTCYPFDAAFRGPERYVVMADLIEPISQEQSP